MNARRTLLRLLLSVATAAFMLAMAAPAAAVPFFPGALAQKLGTDKVPPCSICHVCGVTGRGTVNTPWGAAMRARGLVAYDVDSLNKAVDKMRADKIDSDGDGTLDVDAIAQGKDPNPPTCTGDDPTIPAYGCVNRVVPTRTIPDDSAVFLAFAVAAATVLRRRRSGRGAAMLIAVVVFASATAACVPKSGAALATRSDAETHAARIPRMPPVEATMMRAELRAVGLDPANLPRFEALSSRQRRRLMGTFVRSLGLACNDCHDRADWQAPTRTKVVTVEMWNELTRPFAMAGGAVYCDSCHHGEARLLDRTDKKRVAAFMADQFLGRLDRHDQSAVECETCHGEPFRPLFLSR
jgi:hypothetical protein